MAVKSAISFPKTSHDSIFWVNRVRLGVSRFPQYLPGEVYPNNADDRKNKSSHAVMLESVESRGCPHLKHLISQALPLVHGFKQTLKARIAQKAVA
jgi:hypothetical protein